VRDAPEALTVFCEAEWPRLVRTLSLITGDVEVARELAQETLVRVSRRWKRVETLDSPGAWANRVGINMARSHLRRRAAEKRAIERLPSRAGARWIADGVESTASVLAVREALATLSERHRTVLVARYWLDWSVRDTASALRCPEGTVKTLTRQAIEQLRATSLLEPEVSDVP
jgi:RNA polymerase sigma factor (sigma-70 family)